MRTPEVIPVLERLCNLLRMEARAFGLRYGLQPVQLEALTYITRCNRYSNTPQAVTEYLGLTKGTVSQTIKVLEHKGLLRKQTDKHDKRKVHLSPSAKGRKLIEESLSAKGLGPVLNIAKSVETSELAPSLRLALHSMQQANGLKTFAACHTCRFNGKHENGYFCGLTQEPLSTQDIQLICREHQYPPEPT